MTTFRSDDANPRYATAFFVFVVIAAVASIPLVNAEIAKQNMAATGMQKVLLCGAFGAILAGVATFFFWLHKGSRRGLITGLLIIVAFVFFGVMGATS